MAFRAGLVTRDGAAGLRAREARRAADMLRDALIFALSVTRRAGIMISFVLLYFTNSYLLVPSLARAYSRAFDARQSSDRYADYAASLRPESENPRASWDDFL
jgi:hypothetical protein